MSAITACAPTDTHAITQVHTTTHYTIHRTADCMVKGEEPAIMIRELIFVYYVCMAGRVVCVVSAAWW